ncbi:MAG TPA: hypothetical protein VMM78_06465 [Thermomicrobiales bacterium]|nr:hypothetical protein [Thermomicrobiales bacterium]
MSAYLLSLGLMYLVTEDWGDGYYLMPLLLGYPVVGAVIVSRQPRHAIGWLLVSAGSSIALGIAAAGIVDSTIGADPALWQRALALIANIAFISGFECLLLSLAFLFPTGRTLSRRWRVAAIVAATIVVSWFIYAAFKPGPLEGYFTDVPQLTNPIGIAGVDEIGRRLTPLYTILGMLVVVTSLASIVTRVWRSRGVERLQLQWFGLAVGVTGAGVLISGSASLLPDRWSWIAGIAESVFFLSGAFGIPAAIGIAILRYRLYDLGRLVNRGLVYLALTLSLGLVYLGLVLVLGTSLRTVSGQSSGLVTAASTLLVAALFRPLRSGIQNIVNRRFYRHTYDAARTIEEFSARLRDDGDIDAVSRDLQFTAQQAMQPAHVSLWLRPHVPDRAHR